MGQQPSKDELVYQRASNGDVEGIKALAAEGAGLEVIGIRNSFLYFTSFLIDDLVFVNLLLVICFSGLIGKGRLH